MRPPKKSNEKHCSLVKVKYAMPMPKYPFRCRQMRECRGIATPGSKPNQKYHRTKEKKTGDAR